MINKTPREMAEIAAEKLQGTCGSLVNLGEEFEELQNDSNFCDRLDELVFECVCCNWWCGISEMSDNVDEWICKECEED